VTDPLLRRVEMTTRALPSNAIYELSTHSIWLRPRMRFGEAWMNDRQADPFDRISIGAYIDEVSRFSTLERQAGNGTAVSVGVPRWTRFELLRIIRSLSGPDQLPGCQRTGRIPYGTRGH